MSEWNVEILNEAVRDELRSLPRECQAHFAWISRLLITNGPEHVGMPHVQHLCDNLWEMRLRGRGTIGRALYAAVPDRRLVVLHVFAKKTRKVPRRAINLALRRMREVDG